MASTIRINGLFLVAALETMYLLRERGRTWWRLRPGDVALGIGPAFVAWWVTWLHDRTGLWNA